VDTETQGEFAVGKKLEFWFYGKFLKEMVVTTLKVDDSCGGAQLSGAILIGLTPKLNGKSSAKATTRFFTFATQKWREMPNVPSDLDALGAFPA